MSGERKRGTEARAREREARDARARAAGYANYGAQWRAQNPEKVNRSKRTRAAGTNPRATGSNTRTRGTNPRAVAANPRARLGTDAAFTERTLRRALARHRVTTGEPWCHSCDDSGFTYPHGVAVPCPDHRVMTTADAYPILHPD